MGIIEKCGLNGEGDASSDEEEIPVPRAAPSETSNDDDKAKAKKKAAAKKILNKAKVQSIGAKIQNAGFKVEMLSPPHTKKGKMLLLSTQMKGKEATKTSSKKPNEDGVANKVKREINSRPKRLSKELAAVCGKRTLSRHEVS